MGVSLVSACQNHHEALRYTLPSWLKLESLHEIILIDWSSKPSLHLLVEELDGITDRDPALYVIEVKDQAKWEPSRAFNLGFRAAHCSHVLRVECDHKVRDDFIVTHDLRGKAFFAGNTHLERSESDEDLFGTLFIKKKSFFDVGGYDERIQDYGGEQDDVFNRLEKNGFQRLDIDYDKLLHNHHHDSRIDGNLTSIHIGKRIEIETNAELLQSLPPWNNLEAWRSFSFNAESLSSPNGSTRSHIHSNVQYRTITADSHTAPSIREMTSEPVLEKAKHKVTSGMLLEEFDMPLEFSDILTLPEKVTMLKTLMRRKLNSSRSIIPRVLVIHCVGALVPRMFALASGLSVATQTDRLPVVIWQKEIPLVSATLGELFQREEELMVINVDNGTFPTQNLASRIQNKARGSLDVYDLTKAGGQKPKLIRSERDVHIYVKASNALRTNVLRHTNPLSMREQIHALGLHESIQRQLRNLEDQGVSNAVGIYVANSTSSEAPDLDTFSLSVRERLRKLTSSSLARVYIDSDPHVFEKLRKMFASVLIAPSVSKNCDSEDPQCTRTELTRLFALSKTREFMSLQDDDFSALVRLIRGHSTQW